MKIRRLAASFLIAAGLGFTAATHAVTITFVATDLFPDVPEGDLWRYTYQVSGSFAAFGGVNLLFPPLDAANNPLYGPLQNPPPAVNADWSVIILAQPDPGLPADGIYQATALVDNPSLTDPFTVDFVWLGGPRTPGGQTFEEFPPDGQLPFPIGTTGPPGGTQVPLPGTLALLVAGVLALSARRPRNAD